jgi:8-oxo-dGTP pyrophosphatase MutT (NUDIX family)
MPPSLSSLLAPFPPSTHAALARLHAALAAPQPPLVALHALPHSARAAVAVVLFLDCAAHPAAFRPFVSPSEAERGSGSSAEEGKPEWLVLLTTRSLTVGSHPGQASLPGGKMERGEDARRTAAREMREEIALDVREGAVEVGEGKSCEFA